MFDEQQASPPDESGDATEEAHTPTRPSDERSSVEPVASTKGPDAGEGETERSGEEEDSG